MCRNAGTIGAGIDIQLVTDLDGKVHCGRAAAIIERVIGQRAVVEVTNGRSIDLSSAFDEYRTAQRHVVTGIAVNNDLRRAGYAVDAGVAQDRARAQAGQLGCRAVFSIVLVGAQNLTLLENRDDCNASDTVVGCNHQRAFGIGVSGV